MTRCRLYEKLQGELCGKVTAGVEVGGMLGSGELGWSCKRREKHQNSLLPAMARVDGPSLKSESMIPVRKAHGVLAMLLATGDMVPNQKKLAPKGE